MSQLHRRDVLWLSVVSHHDPLRLPLHCRGQNERRRQWIDFVLMVVTLHAWQHCRSSSSHQYLTLKL
jgi:hypothetical protein